MNEYSGFAAGQLVTKLPACIVAAGAGAAVYVGRPWYTWASFLLVAALLASKDIHLTRNK